MGWWTNDPKTKTCPGCRGTGKIVNSITWFKCTVCKGAGKVEDR